MDIQLQTLSEDCEKDHQTYNPSPMSKELKAVKGSTKGTAADIHNFLNLEQYLQHKSICWAPVYPCGCQTPY